MAGSTRVRGAGLVSAAVLLALGPVACGDVPADGGGGPAAEQPGAGGGPEEPVSDAPGGHDAADGPDGSDGGESSGPDGAEEPAEPEVTEPPEPGVFQRRAERVAAAWPDVEPLPAFDPNVWRVQGVEEAALEDTALTVLVGHGSCDHGWGAQVHETAELVIVGNWTFQREGEVMACDDMLHLVEMRVELAEPLGERTVVDAATGMDVYTEEFTGGL
ncbi:hypothetical protein [Streptomyces sp. YIM 98790]|uniref:hypothetical protein n=1 Tax=Streptomyces sp. YIM 98790 TaxID=2689077 RepID=UPI00140988BD|nr:hypothetical protein [Streptomyces sp. YIM 98790]